MTRNDYIKALGTTILDAMEHTQEMQSGAVYDGRVGLNSMTDEDLLVAGAIWGMPDETIEPEHTVQKYTVLLLRPDYMADNYGEDTFSICVEAENVEEAVALAQTEAFQVDTTNGQGERDEDIDEDLADDYLALFVAKGDIPNLAP